VRELAGGEVREALLADYMASGARGKPNCLAELLGAARVAPLQAHAGKQGAARQGRHVGQRGEIQKAAAAA
jgi:hypothetical protein